MRRAVTVAACALCGVTLGSLGSSAAPPADAAPQTTCVWPIFRGAIHRPHELRKTRLPVAERVGTAVFHRNWNLQCFREERFVHRLRGIAVGRAVSVNGSQRELLIRGQICIRAPYEAALVRCLKRPS